MTRMELLKARWKILRDPEMWEDHEYYRDNPQIAIQDFECAIYHGVQKDGPLRRWWYLHQPLLFTKVAWFFRAVPCILSKSHKWVDHSYGGPETGCISLTCSRCGEEVYERLY